MLIQTSPNTAGIVVHICNSSNWEAEAEGWLLVGSHPGLLSEVLSPKKKTRKKKGDLAAKCFFASIETQVPVQNPC